MQKIGRPDGGRRLAEAIPLGSSREGETMFTGKQQNKMEYTQIDSICFFFFFFSSYLGVCLFLLQVNNTVQPRRSFQPTDGPESHRRLLKFCFQIPCKHTAAEHNRYYTVLRYGEALACFSFWVVMTVSNNAYLNSRKSLPLNSRPSVFEVGSVQQCFRSPQV